MIPLRDYRTSRSFPTITVILIAINLVVFLYQGYLATRPVELNDGIAWQDSGFAPPAFDPNSYVTHVRNGGDPALYPISADDYFLLQYALIPAELLGGRDLPPTVVIPLWLTLLTSMFMHGSLWHLIGNMLYLWIFGDNVEDAMGHGRFLVFYILCGLIAALAQIVTGVSSAIPMIGASGAIAAVLAAYFMLFPRSRVLTLVPIFFFIRLMNIPAVVLLGVWFLYQVLSGAGSLGASVGGTAWFAHIGGFVAGLLLVFVFKKRGVPVVLWQMVTSRRRI